jgi:predicted transcriptional regulator
MARPASRHPTELELRILKVLWREGRATVRAVRDALAAGGRELAYTSVMTVMNIMARKRYLSRARDGGSFVYRTRVEEEDTSRRMLRDMVRRVFGGSPAALVMNLLETADVDERELEVLREMVNRKAREDTP